MAKRPTLTGTMRKPAVVQSTVEPAPIEPPETVMPAAPTPVRKVAPSRAGLRQITMHQSPEVMKILKHLAADLERSQQSLLAEALNDFFARHGKPRICNETLGR